MVIIYIHLKELDSLILHAKFQDHRPLGSGEEKVFTIYRHCGHLGHVTWTIYTNFGSPFTRRLHIIFGFDWLSGFRDDLENGGLTPTDGRRFDGYTLNHPVEL